MIIIIIIIIIIINIIKRHISLQLSMLLLQIGLC